MTENTKHFEAANRRYAQERHRRDLPPAPARKVSVLTCMDARIDVEQALGLAQGDAHVVRNAGGRASADAIRSIIISQQLGTREVVVIHHTNCGLQNITNDSLRQKLRNELGADASAIDFLPFTDLAQSVIDDVATLRATPLIPDDIAITGYIFDVQTGELTRVPT